MNKFKKVMLGALSVLTLGLFVATGAKVSATTIDTEFDFYTVMKGDFGTSTSVNVINGSGSENYEATAKGGTKKSNLTVSLSGTNDKTYYKWNKSSYFEFTVNAATDTLTFSFVTTGANASVDMIIHTGGGSRYYTYFIDSATTGTEFANGNTTTKQTFNFATAGEHSIKFQRTASIGGVSTSNMKIYSLDLKDSYVDSSITNEALAEAAISNIGTVSYSKESLDLINAAKTAILACDEANRNADHISNYATYTAAVSSFEEKEATAIIDFTSSVTAIGTLNKDSLTKINVAKSKYEVLFGDTLSDSDVTEAKSSLDSIEAQYMLEYGEKLTTLLTSSISSTLKTNAAFSSDTRFYTSTKSSIFFGSKTSSIQEGNGKTYDNVSYTDRFKTNGVISLSGDDVICALRIDAPSGGKLSVVAISGNGSSTRNLKLVKVNTKNDNSKELETIQDLGNVVGGANANLYTLDIPSAGTYYIGSDTVLESNKSAGGVNMYKFEFTSMSDNTSASVFAEKNTSGDTLKFVGTLTGITDLTNVGSIELILTLNGTATAKQIFLKTCYTSVTGLSENAPECGVATNTYYTIYRISGVSGLKGTITKQLKVTFTDGSTTTSELTEIVLK